jgi:hypothetical protein
MDMGRVGVGFALLALSIACGGATESDSSSGAAACAEPQPQARCVADCAGTGTTMSMECRGGAWQCPDGHTPFSSCPRGTCLASSARCCGATTGVISLPTCDEDGANARCGPDADIIEVGSRCRRPEDPRCPTDASDIEGKACSSSEVGVSCEYGTTCGGLNCGCGPKKRTLRSLPGVATYTPANGLACHSADGRHGRNGRLRALSMSRPSFGAAPKPTLH